MFKRFIFLVMACSLSCQVFASGYYLSFSDGDTLRVSPNLLVNRFASLPVVAEFDNGVANHFRLQVTHSTLLSYVECYTSASTYGVHIPYIKSDGSADVYDAAVTVVEDEEVIDMYTRQTIVESSTTVYGYWDYNNDGIYEPYGLVKWGPGHYDHMFDMVFEVNGDCTGDSIVIDGLITSTYDSRYPTYTINSYQFYRVVHLVMAYMRGDVNGDESVDMNDVSALIDYLSDILTLNQYQLDAADVNGSGEVDINDVSYLIDMLLGFDSMEDEPVSE